MLSRYFCLVRAMTVFCCLLASPLWAGFMAKEARFPDGATNPLYIVEGKSLTISAELLCYDTGTGSGTECGNDSDEGVFLVSSSETGFIGISFGSTGDFTNANPARPT